MTRLHKCSQKKNWNYYLVSQVLVHKLIINQCKVWLAFLHYILLAISKCYGVLLKVAPRQQSIVASQARLSGYQVPGAGRLTLSQASAPHDAA